MRYWFDLSTSARWSGHPVGIVRVERELGRRAADRLGASAGFCVYDRQLNNFHEISAEHAARIVEGRLQIDFVGGGPTPVADGGLRRRIRNAVLARPRLYQQVQRLRGRSFSLEQIAEVRRTEEAQRKATAASAVETIRFEDIAPEPLALDQDDVVISAGLDWEYKDLRSIYRLKQARRFRYAAVLYDLIPLLHPHYVVPAYVHLLRDYFGELFWVADYCLSISESTQKDMLAYCADQGVAAPAADHFPLGGDLPATGRDADEPLPAGLQQVRYGVFVSTIEPRKNHRTLYEAWDRCVREGRVDPAVNKLVFVGRQGWNVGDLLTEIAANPATADSIIILSNVSDGVLRRLYQNADFALFPSHYEGYGLPVAEALSYGKPCICSGGGSLPEVGGDMVVYCDPREPAAWAGAIARAFAHPDLLADQSARIREQYRAVTWDDAAQLFFSRLSALVEGDHR